MGRVYTNDELLLNHIPYPILLKTSFIKREKDEVLKNGLQSFVDLYHQYNVLQQIFCHSLSIAVCTHLLPSKLIVDYKIEIN